MTNDLTATPVAPPKRSKGLLITWAVLVVLGTVGVILLIVGAVQRSRS